MKVRLIGSPRRGPWAGGPFRERGGPFWGGLICGVPIASGPAYVMLALQADPAFVAQSALNRWLKAPAAARNPLRWRELLMARQAAGQLF